MIRVYTIDSDGYQFNVAGISAPLSIINRTIELATEARETDNSVFLAIQIHNMITAAVTLATDVAYVNISDKDYKMELNAGNGGIYYNNTKVTDVPAGIVPADDRMRIFKQARNLLVKKMSYLILRDLGYTAMADKLLFEYNRDRLVYTGSWIGYENEILNSIDFEVIDNK